MQSRSLLLQLFDGLVEISRRQRIKAVIQQSLETADFLLKLFALLAHGRTAKNRRERAALSVIDGCRGRVDDGYNFISNVRFRTYAIFYARVVLDGASEGETQVSRSGRPATVRSSPKLVAKNPPYKNRRFQLRATEASGVGISIRSVMAAPGMGVAAPTAFVRCRSRTAANFLAASLERGG